MHKHLALVIVMAACGGGAAKPDPAKPKAPVANVAVARGDSCQQFIEKSRPFFAGAARNPSETLTEEDLEQLVELCRHDMMNDPLVGCVNGAADDKGVLDCWQRALSKVGAAPSTAPSAGRASP